jgi:regulator-associated protein of mTOR
VAGGGSGVAASGTGTGSSGSVGREPPLLSAFSALPELHHAPAHTVGTAASAAEAGLDAAAGLVLHWLPSRGHLVAAGGRAPYMRIWDLQSERCTALVPLLAPGAPSAALPTDGGEASGAAFAAGAVAGGDATYVTCVASAWPGTDILVAGTSSGAVQVLDMRLAGRTTGSGAVVMSLREHTKWVVGVAQARSGSAYALVSGSVTADVRFWDLRRPTSLATILAHRSPMTSLALHDFAPLLATGTRKQLVRVFTNSGDPLTEIRYHAGFLGQRIGPVSCLAFHPHRLFLAVGATDSIVSVHAGATTRADASDFM